MDTSAASAQWQLQSRVASASASSGSQPHRAHSQASRSSIPSASHASAIPSYSSSSSRPHGMRKGDDGRGGGVGGGGSCASVGSAGSSASSSLGLGLGALRGLDGGPAPMEFADGLQTNDEDVNLFLMVEWARTHKRTKQAHAAAAAAANGAAYLRPLHSDHSGPSAASQAPSSSIRSSTTPLYNYSPPSLSRAISVSHGSVSHSSRPSPEPTRMQMQAPTDPPSHASAHADASAHMATSAQSSPAVTPLQARKRVRTRSRENSLAAEQALPTPHGIKSSAAAAAAAASPAIAASATSVPPSMIASPLCIRVHREKDDGVSEHSDEQIEVKFHDSDEMASSSTAVVSPLPPQPRELQGALAMPAPTSAAAAPAASPFVRLTSLVPSLVPSLLALMELPCRIHYMQVCRRWRDEVLSSRVIWEGSHWNPCGARPCMPNAARGPGGDGCAVLARLNQTYGVGAEHARWIVPPLPPHSFLLSRLQHLDLRPAGVGGDSLTRLGMGMGMGMGASSASVAGGGSGAPGARGVQWSDAHLVLLPYFSSLLTLDLSYLGCTEPGELNSTGSSTQSAMAGGAAPRVSGVILGRVALLPQLRRLVLDHVDWIDDEALACLRNKYNCRLALTPGEAPPNSAGCNVSAAELAMAAASSGSIQPFSFASPSSPAPAVAFLPPSHSLPSLTHLSLEFLPRLTPRGLAYLLSESGLPGLQELNLANSARAVSAVSMRALEESNARTLHSLNLGWCGGMGRAASPSASLATLAPLARMPQLTHLELRGWAELREETLQAFCDQAAAGTGAASGAGAASASVSRPSALLPAATGAALRSLNLRGCSSLSSRGLSLLSRFSSTLVALDLSDCRSLCDSTLRLLGFSLHALTRLVLWNAPLLTDRGVESLLCGGQSLQACWALQQAHHARAVHALGAEAAGPWWPTEQSLAQSHSLSSAGSSAALPCLLHSLRSLSLSSAPLLTDVSCALLRFCTRLEELDLRDVAQIGDGGVAALCAEFTLPNGASCGALRRTLRSLHLSRLGSGLLTSACGASLRHMRALTSLDVSWNESVDDGLLMHLFAPAGADAPAWADASVQPTATNAALPPPPAIQRLNLARCAITEPGLQLLAGAASKRFDDSRLAPLSELDLRYCPFLTLAQLDSLLRRVAPACVVEHTCMPPDEEEEGGAAADAPLSEAEADNEADIMPAGFLQLAVAPPSPDQQRRRFQQQQQWLHGEDGTPPADPIVLPPNPATVALMAAAARAPSACSNSSSHSRRSSSSDCSRGADAVVVVAGRARAASSPSSDVDDSAADPFRVECQVVENEDDEEEHPAGLGGYSSASRSDRDEEEEEDDDDDESDSSSVSASESDESMVSHSDAHHHATHLEQDEQGQMWAVHEPQC